MAYNNFESSIDRITKNYINNRENVALTIGVVEQGNHYIKGFGKFNDTDDSLPNAGTIYEIGSVTKVFTGIVLAKTGVAILSNYGDAVNNDLSVDEMGIVILMEL